ncbi:uncharacterized protein SCHCODRAFT_02495493, partial [Schizophyllum commune H4-8]|uniref:uncharacterized protein n=1 Tax=Schizophyllum commune (strain H4-8 / FGSC 9210) TaxID=578458 RepID=UPI0021608689
VTDCTRSVQLISFLFSPEVSSPAHRVFEGRLPGGRAGYRADLERAGGRAFPLWLAISPYQLHAYALCFWLLLLKDRTPGLRRPSSVPLCGGVLLTRHCTR